ncbi:capsular polysaccharide synthesis protein [Nitrincola schmidtii]|uniref:capsular polysaccharide synthesis protein n=1 Tax=Nitrincola schmidtii TaxID=1730894 RepID=UPI00145789C3|nr:capsular polysaccharide synthesis protein [Nitrincola schmidtii]
MKIWAAWLQGRNNAPHHVQTIFKLWEDLNPNHSFHVVENIEAEKIIESLGIQQKVMTPQVKTNIVRTYLLSTEGGVWVDSTLLPTKPLDSWLNDELKKQGFFAFNSSGAPELVLQNWFIYAEKDNPLISGWLKYYVDYFQSTRYYPSVKRALYHLKIIDYLKYKIALKNKDYTYFVDKERGRACSFYPYAVHNYNFYYMLKQEKDLYDIWHAVPKLYNLLPCFIGRSGSDKETPDNNFVELALEALKISPVHKLNHRDARFITLIDEAIKRKLIEYNF